MGKLTVVGTAPASIASDITIERNTMYFMSNESCLSELMQRG